jgi:hypothetical protein
MKEPKDIVLPMLKEMRAEIASLRARMDERFDENDKAHKSFRNALSADTLMGRILGERIEKLESKVRAFEGRS